ncbi:NAD(P)-dependent alcohol dehydrogenase [Nostoc sp. 'Lobaria pulmonaria (5183) cyanobiont']|uniref:NAD(P)-dependent alcohol dehydrogenase n=1 Tax=Nostoc sp. 'Lobaria pulmonaria (5183) cyanobiont' TaxID=1618022 RepID=UPI000CF3481E|nr:NAD(P)-dependent alcohol dehydrogenase [Nostoc sp. 'Lobaria pulmonaria (5183) cyanobiont']AVH72195.1 alcohol dehydrogenase [Nostoc sp. 'Lobaria pulmonaria (5183) cyanobiont']
MPSNTSLERNQSLRCCYGLAALGQGDRLVSWAFDRRELRPNDIAVKIQFCGVCHSDLHAIRGKSRFPLVPGHEMVGEVTAIGADVTKFRIGDAVVVGTIIDSCRHCPPCISHLEQYCREGVTNTYDSIDRHDGSITRGGYSNEYVVDTDFAYHIPSGLDPASVAPLLCAGVTTWSPLRHWDVGPGKTVGIVGLGGLGHMAVKFAHALGAHVVLFSTSAGKLADAKALGANEAIVSTDEAQMAGQASRFDFILDTVSSRHPLNPYLRSLKLDGTLCCLGIPADMDFSPVFLTMGRRRLASSGVGGTRETQEMLDFCSQHNISADVEIISAADIDDGFERLERGEVRYRLVIDMSTLEAPAKVTA